MNTIKEKLKEIEFYKRFPTMIPFVGENYISKKHKKLLIVGESFYFPNEADIHKSPERWYNSSQDDLSDYELRYINPTSTFEEKSDPIFICKEINSCVIEASKTCKVQIDKRGIDEIAFCNYFHRPSESEGASIKSFVTELDFVKAKGIFSEVLKVLEPDIVVFFSVFTWDHVGLEYRNSYTNILFDYVCNPGNPQFYWYNTEYPHNSFKFVKILVDNFFILEA